jgi:hypothetical protein
MTNNNQLIFICTPCVHSTIQILFYFFYQENHASVKLQFPDGIVRIDLSQHASLEGFGPYEMMLPIHIQWSNGDTLIRVRFNESNSEIWLKLPVNEFDSLYTFYLPGFNLRATDLQAFIGLSQLEKLDTIINNRNKNYERYRAEIKNNFWIIKKVNLNYKYFSILFIV